MKPRLAFIESSDIAAGYSAEAARALGFDPVFLCDLTSYHGDPKRQIERTGYVQSRTSSLSSVLEKLSGMGRIEAVLTFADTRLKVAAEAARALGVMGVDPAVIKLKDKKYVADLAPEYGPPAVGFAPGNPPFNAIAHLMGISGSVIIKPSEGAGALGTFEIRSEEELADIPSRIAAMKLPSNLAENWVAQSFVSGELVSLEGYVLGGKPHFLGFTSRSKVGLTESSARFPIDSRLSARMRARACETVEALVERSGFVRGYFHIEFIAAGNHCHLIDANMGRIGGGAIAEQIAVSYGVTPEEVCRHILETTLFGEEREPIYEGSPNDSYAIFYGLPRRDRIDEVRVPLESGCRHTQILGDGCEAPAMGENDWAWVGILSGPTRAVERAIAGTRIQTGSGPQVPYY